MKVSKKQKAHRVLDFLLGLGNRRIQADLIRFGLSQKEINRGHELLLRATRATLAPEAPQANVIKQLDEFENLWFPIVRTCLNQHFPRVGDWLFVNLFQTSGINLVVSVGTLLRRLNELSGGSSEFGAEGQRAMSQLALRGLNAAALGEVQLLLDGLQVFAPEEPHGRDSEGEEAEAAMWRWYLEWSAIARAAIKDRRLLKALGFLRNSRRAAQKPTTVDS